LAVRLEWEDKSEHVERISLPFQTVEAINESRATRERDAGSLLRATASARIERNQLIWGDNKLVILDEERDRLGSDHKSAARRWDTRTAGVQHRGSARV